MLKSKTALGIDIGTLTIKLVELAPSKNGPVLINYAIAPIPDAAELIEEKDPDIRIEKIAFIVKNILKERKIKAGNVAISISSRSIFTRFVKMPFSDSKKLEKLISFEAQQQIPFPLEKVSWDHQIVGKNEDGDFEVLIAAIKQEELSQQLRVFAETKLSPVIVDVGALSLYNSLLRSQIKPDEKAIVLDVGANPATLILHHPGGYWVRTLAFSGYAITQTLMRTFNIPYEEAESLKFKGFILPDNAKPKDMNDVKYKINHIITSNAKKLYTEIMRSLSFYRTQFNDIEFDRLILSGGGSRMDDLKLYLSSKLKINVDHADPIEGIQIGSGIDVQEINEVAYLYGETIGLALRQIEPCKVELNLMTISANIGSTVRKLLKYYFFIIFVIAAALGWNIYNLSQKQVVLEEKKQAILSEDQRLQTLKAQIKKESDKIAAISKEHQLYLDITQNRGFWIKWYQMFNNIVQDEIFFSQFEKMEKSKKRDSNLAVSNQLNEFNVMLAGVAKGREVFDTFIEKIQLLEGVEKVEMVRASLDQLQEVGVIFEIIVHVDVKKATKAS